MASPAEKLQTPTAKSCAAPLPQTVSDTGLNVTFLEELACKHLYEAGELSLGELSRRLAFAWQVSDEILARLRGDALLEMRRNHNDQPVYRLTEKGRSRAFDALRKSAYTGPAPVPLADYVRIATAQTISGITVTREKIATAYQDVIITDQLLDLLGPAVHSGRALFMYGAPGTGKTFLGKRIRRLLGGDVMVPHAISVDDKVITFFDPVIHEPVTQAAGTQSLLLSEQHDLRFVPCKRPAVTVGGELTMDMLELGFDSHTGTYQAPMHVKANNGVFMIDDLGRQRLRVEELLNRWIVPLEEKHDYFALESGVRFQLPIDLILVFSTNLDPKDLVDDAFLRRLGYKIRLTHLDEAQYSRLWNDTIAEKQMTADAGILEYLLDNLYRGSKRELLACHPRDLLGIVADQCRYENATELRVTQERVRRAWNAYFVN